MTFHCLRRLVDRIRTCACEFPVLLHRASMCFIHSYDSWRAQQNDADASQRTHRRRLFTWRVIILN